MKTNNCFNADCELNKYNLFCYFWVTNICNLKNRFLKNLGYFLALNLIIKPIYVFGIDMIVQNNVGAEVYGSYFPLLNLVLIFQIFLDLGIENYTRKEVARSPGLTNRLLSNFLVLKIILTLFFICSFSLIGFFLPQSNSEWKLLLVLLVNQSMANFILYLRANMGGLQLFKSESVVSVLDRLFMIFACGTLLIIPATHASFKMEWFVLTQTCAYAFTLIVSLIIVLRKTGKIKFNTRFISYIPVLKQLWPFALLALLMAFYYRIDSILLRFLLPNGKEQAGIYAHGFRILDFMSNYALIFSFILLPTFASKIRNNEKVIPLLRQAGIALIIPSSAALFGIFFYRFDVFNILYKEHGHLSANVFGVMNISFIGVCISYTFGALLTANGNLKELNLMAATAVIISIVLNSILIPKYQVLGAAIANACTQLFTIAFHIIVVKKKFDAPLNYPLIAKFIAFFIFSTFLGILISRTSLPWYFGILLISLISLGFSVSIRLLKITGVRDLLPNNLFSK